MGLCYEFGPQIHAGCTHPMVAAGRWCECKHCGTRCDGRFPGCAGVWESGSQPALLAGPAAGEGSATIDVPHAGAHRSDPGDQASAETALQIQVAGVLRSVMAEVGAMGQAFADERAQMHRDFAELSDLVRKELDSLRAAAEASHGGPNGAVMGPDVAAGPGQKEHTPRPWS